MYTAFHDVPQSALLKEATNCLFHRASYTQTSIAKKSVQYLFRSNLVTSDWKNTTQFFRDFPLKCSTKTPNSCLFLTASSTQSRIIDRQYKTHFLTEFVIMNCKAGQTGNAQYIVNFKKMKIEEKKIVHSLIFFYEEATIGGVLLKSCS